MCGEPTVTEEMVPVGGAGAKRVRGAVVVHPAVGSGWVVLGYFAAKKGRFAVFRRKLDIEPVPFEGDRRCLELFEFEGLFERLDFAAEFVVVGEKPLHRSGVRLDAGRSVEQRRLVQVRETKEVLKLGELLQRRFTGGVGGGDFCAERVQQFGGYLLCCFRNRFRDCRRFDRSSWREWDVTRGLPRRDPLA